MSEKRTIQSVLKNLKELVESRTPVSPEQFIDAAMFLQTLKFDEIERRLALEIIAKKKYREIRKLTKSAIDAKIEWETTEEWENWRRQDELLREILEFTRIAKKEAEIRKMI